MNVCYDMKCYLCYLAKDRIKTQSINFYIKFYQMKCVIDDQHPRSGSISVFLITKYNINSVLSLYHITIHLHIMIYITVLIYMAAALVTTP